MNKKKFTIIQLVGMLLFIAIVASASYAFFAARIIDDENSQAFFGQAANLELIFEAEDTLISGEDIYPGWKDSANFKLINKGTPTYYTLYIKNIVNNFDIYGSIAFEIISQDGGGNVPFIYLPSDISQKDLVVNVLIAEKTTHNYTINVYYNNFDVIDQAIDKGKDFSFEIGIKSASTGVAGGTVVDGLYDCEFAYTGGEQFFVAPISGVYKIEAWGASGGVYSTFVEGKGAYTSGNIALNKKDVLYINVGEAGSVAEASSTLTAGGFNGGGSAYYSGGTGGGATDIRFGGNTLYDRIMVAGGGGGTGMYNANNKGGSAGGLTGYSGGDYSSSYKGGGDGGTQISGGTIGSGTIAGGVGTFGFGGAGGHPTSSSYPHGSGAGGGGYYGGAGGSSRDGGGGGGSSYISGHTGSVAIKSSTNTSPRNSSSAESCTTGTSDNSCSVHYSGKTFTETVMIDGTGYAWTNAKGLLTQMPNPAGDVYASGVGHTGNGYIKISLYDSLEPEVNAKSFTGGKIKVETNYFENAITSYCVNQDSTSSDGCTWISETSSSFTTESTYNHEETYFVYVKDSKGNIYRSNAVFVFHYITEEMFTFIADSTSVATPYEYIKEDGYNWRIRFLTTGTVTFDVSDEIDVFIVGGGGGGGCATIMNGTWYGYPTGGGGGYNTLEQYIFEPNVGYKITIGAGGVAPNQVTSVVSTGGTSSAFGFSAKGGGAGGWYISSSSYDVAGSGGSGGGGYKGYGGVNGADGTGTYAGKGSGVNSYEFRETSSGILYGSGGVGARISGRINAAANTGDGGSGSNEKWVGGNGGSGIVVIRNKRS